MKSAQPILKAIRDFNKGSADVHQHVRSVSLYISIRTTGEYNREFSEDLSSREFSLRHYLYVDYFFIFFSYLNGEFQSQFFG